MSFSDPDYVAELLTDVLDAGETALLGAGRPIDRVVRFYGVPSWDCEMLAVWPNMSIQFPNGPTVRHAAHRLNINVALLRCVTAITVQGIPNASTVDSDGEGFAIDMWTLQRTYTEAIIGETLFDSGLCNQARMLPFVPLSPGGNLSGMTTTIELTL